MTVAVPSVSEVRAVITTPLDDVAVQVFIDDAALLADACPKVATYPEARQKAIVRWLTAHLITSSSGTGQLTSSKLGDASETYGRASLGVALSGTYYGQQAIALDPSGCLERVGRQRAFVQVL